MRLREDLLLHGDRSVPTTALHLFTPSRSKEPNWSVNSINKSKTEFTQSRAGTKATVSPGLLTIVVVGNIITWRPEFNSKNHSGPEQPYWVQSSLLKRLSCGR